MLLQVFHPYHRQMISIHRRFVPFLTQVLHYQWIQ